jgi:hypothetical protein
MAQNLGESRMASRISCRFNGSPLRDQHTGLKRSPSDGLAVSHVRTLQASTPPKKLQ